MADAWVVNASPLIVLAKIGRLDLLTNAVDHVIVPEPVATEILAGPADDPARRALESGWGSRVASDNTPTSILEWGLGSGESSVLAVALDRSLTAVLDDAEARSCARAQRIPVIGTLGVVLRATQRGAIVTAVPVLRAVCAAGLRLNDKVVRAALAELGDETWDA